MSSVHGVSEVHSLNSLLTYGGVLLVVLAVHLTRALAVRPATARRWAAQRGLVLDERSQHEVERHLRRTHWGRFLGSLVVGSASLTLMVLWHTGISFLSLPLLVGVLIAELLVPEPRRGRVRAVVLQQRGSSYFAPATALIVTRALLLLGIAATTWTVVTRTDHRHPSLMPHLVVLLVGWAVLEVALRRIARRGLPDRADDLALDCVIRVADSRTLTAAGRVFATIGALVASVSTGSHLGRLGAQLVGQLIMYATVGAVIWAITLVQPLREWRPA
jgi:hypothetical protein